ncbi:MAG: hypothetical protein ACYDDF_05430 [Thermoplasmatota archaeon]
MTLLVGGVVILIGGLSMAVLMGGLDGLGALPYGMMGYGFAWAPWMSWWVGGVSILAGATVLAAAAGVRSSPLPSPAWGIVAIIAGTISFLGMGGYMFGGGLAIIGGALALLRAPETKPQTPAGGS